MIHQIITVFFSITVLVGLLLPVPSFLLPIALGWTIGMAFYYAVEEMLEEIK